MLTRRRQRELVSLARKKGRIEHQAYLIEGVRLVEAAVASGVELLEIVVTHETATDPRVDRMLRNSSVPVMHAEARVLRQITDVEADQGIVAVARLPQGPDTVPEGIERVLVLDGVQDPGNMGTLIRTAAWFGVNAVVAGPGTADAFAPKVVRAAMGGLWDVHLVRVDSLPPLLDSLRAAGYAVYGATMDGRPVRSWQPARPSVLALGSEAHGLSREVESRLDERIHIGGSSARPETARGVESLNVAAAGAVLVYAWTS